jgi:hypothetical protein
VPSVSIAVCPLAFSSGCFPESSGPRSSVLVVIVVPLGLLEPRTDVIRVDEGPAQAVGTGKWAGPVTA